MSAETRSTAPGDRFPAPRLTPSSVAFRALLTKDLRTELRTLQSLPAMALFAVTTFVIFRFGLDRTALSGSLAAGVLWATLLFAAILGINRLFVAEREEGGFDAIRLAPIDRTALFAAKATALLVYLVVLELIVVPVFAVFFLDSASALVPLALVLLLADVGFAATGTLISSMAVHSRARDLLAPLVLLPLVVPLMIAATGASEPLLELGGPAYDRFGTWLAVLGLYDLIFLLVGYAVFDFLLED
jgi:heme exporter protein B